MAEPNLNSTNTDPIVMRWKEPVSDGLRNWYLNALRNDTSFWGYVHIRTNSLNENRSFDGQMDVLTYNKVRSLVVSVDNANPVLTECCDGLIGFGSRGNLTTIVRYDSEATDLPNAQTFRAIVDLLQPKLIAAARL